MSLAEVLAIVALAGLCAVLIARVTRPKGMFSGGKARIPKQLVIEPIEDHEVPFDARQPLDYLTDKLMDLGFRPSETAFRVPALERHKHQLLLIPFVHPHDQSLFLMGIDSRWSPRADLMLHILTPLTGDRRVETTTLGALQLIRPPVGVDLNVVLDADKVEEIWSRHRLALNRYERDARQPFGDDWQELLRASYGSWVKAALRAQRLALTKDEAVYRLRAPS